MANCEIRLEVQRALTSVLRSNFACFLCLTLGGFDGLQITAFFVWKRFVVSHGKRLLASEKQESFLHSAISPFE